MQSLTLPFFLSTTIGEENNDSDSRIIPASLSSCRCLRAASRCCGRMGRGLCLKGVSLLNLIWCLTLSVQPKSESCRVNTSGIAYSSSSILFLHSAGSGEPSKFKFSFTSSKCFGELPWCAALDGLCLFWTISCSACTSTMTLFAGRIMSCLLSFRNTTGSFLDELSGRLSKQLVTNMPPGKEDNVGGSTTIHWSEAGY